MKAFTLTSFGLALSGALGALASPAIPETPTSGTPRSGTPTSNDLYVRNENNRQVKYTGTCSPQTNNCRYETQSGLSAFCRCGFKVCTTDIPSKDCYFDSYSRKCVCQEVI
ncbi:hypothetical protein BDV41DRAFT_536239, partial [Aspergillus transmontanensis]